MRISLLFTICMNFYEPWADIEYFASVYFQEYFYYQITTEEKHKKCLSIYLIQDFLKYMWLQNNMCVSILHITLKVFISLHYRESSSCKKLLHFDREKIDFLSIKIRFNIRKKVHPQTLYPDQYRVSHQ